VSSSIASPVNGSTSSGDEAEDDLAAIMAKSMSLSHDNFDEKEVPMMKKIEREVIDSFPEELQLIDSLRSSRDDEAVLIQTLQQILYSIRLLESTLKSLQELRMPAQKKEYAEILNAFVFKSDEVDEIVSIFLIFSRKS
jgi:hypothetical protein